MITYTTMQVETRKLKDFFRGKIEIVATRNGMIRSRVLNEEWLNEEVQKIYERLKELTEEEHPGNPKAIKWRLRQRTIMQIATSEVEFFRLLEEEKVEEAIATILKKLLNTEPYKNLKFETEEGKSLLKNCIKRFIKNLGKHTIQYTKITKENLIDIMAQTDDALFANLRKGNQKWKKVMILTGIQVNDSYSEIT